MSLQFLLDRYARGELTFAQLNAELDAQIATEPASFDAIVALIQARAKSGDLSNEESQRLLVALTRQKASGTQLRSPIAESAATLRHNVSGSENEATRVGRRDAQAVA